MSETANPSAVEEIIESEKQEESAKPGFFAKLKEKFNTAKPSEKDDEAGDEAAVKGARIAPEQPVDRQAAEDIRDEFESLLEKMTKELDGDGFDPSDLLKAIKALSKKVSNLSESSTAAQKSAEEVKKAHIDATSQVLQKNANSVAKRMSELVGDDVPFEVVLDAWLDMRSVIQRRYSGIEEISAEAFEFAFKKLYADEIEAATKAKVAASPTLSKSSAPVAGAKSLEQRVLEAYRSAK